MAAGCLLLAAATAALIARGRSETIRDTDIVTGLMVFSYLGGVLLISWGLWIRRGSSRKAD